MGDITQHNIKQLKRLNQVVFPVTYNDKFYKDVLEVGELAKLGECSLPHVCGTFSLFDVCCVGFHVCLVVLQPTTMTL